MFFEVCELFSMRKNLIFDKPETTFVILALVFGLTFTFTNPPLKTADEPSHFYKSFDISQGHLIPKNQLSKLPTNFFHLQNFPQNETTNFSKLQHYFSQPLNLNKTIGLNISNIAIYPPLPYLASGSMIFLGSLFNSSPILLMYLGRLVNLLIYIIIVYFAIKIIPIHKYVLLLVALMPMTLYEASSLSADSLNLALSFLTISFFLHLAMVKNKIHTKDILISLLLIFALVFSKQAYAIMALLFLMIPKEKFKNNIKKIALFLIITLPSLISMIIWNLLFKGLYASQRSGLVSSDYNIHFILSNPLNFPTILTNTLVYTFPGYITTFVGIFRGNIYSLPLHLIYLYCMVLIVVSLLDNSKYKLSFKQKIIPLFIFSVVSVSAFLFEFITYTSIGSNIIEGIQGRYFIPVVPLLLLLSYNDKLSNYLSTKLNSGLMKKKLTKHLFIYLFIITYLTVSSYIIYSPTL